ncbi:MAG: hypothetical protein JWQ16_3093 [Novosphingobium sp.]|nr:hypothetical protein [Novosphingobium sp.]
MDTTKQRDSKALEKLASAELEDWFVWDLLATTALEKANYDRLAAIRLLAQAIAELSSRDATSLPQADRAG